MSSNNSNLVDEIKLNSENCLKNSKFCKSSSIEWNNGPDQILPADSYFSTKLDQPVKLKSFSLENKPISVYTMFSKTVRRSPNQNALAFKSNHSWNYIKYSEYWAKCHRAASSFIKLGLDANCCVAILGFNCPEWFISFLGAMFAGGVGCGIYTTNSSEACEYIIKDSKSQILVVENQYQLEKILKFVDSTDIRAIIQYTGKIENNYNGLILSWNEFLEYGDDLPEYSLTKRIKSMAPNKCASLIYTSGTTGMPKAAMISHDCITYTVRNCAINQLQLEFSKERFVSYLPLSHIAGQMIDCFAPILMGGTVYFAQPDALKGTLINTLQEVRPTLFFGVPRVWEKFQEKMETILRNLTPTKMKIFEWARNVTYEQMLCLFDRNDKFNPQFRLARTMVLNKIYKQLGLDMCKTFYSGAAPITKETLDFFISLGIPLCEVYGMSETTGPHCVGLASFNRITSVGRVDGQNLTKVDKKDNDGSGELCIQGRHVFMGYLNDEIKTKEAFDVDGWLHTGDIAKIDNEGFIYITGRLKELIITAGGENIAPIPIEDNIKAELPRLISNCMVVGDKRKYLVVLVTLKSKINLDTFEPLDELTDDCINWLNSVGSKSTHVSDILNNNDPIAKKEIENAIQRANNKSQSRAAKVQKFIVLPRDFTIFYGELGPTLKLRRPIVAKIYSKIIDELYEDRNTSE